MEEQPESRRAYRWLKVLAFLVLMLLALVLGGGRLLMSQLPLLQPQVEAWLAESLPVAVRLEQLEGDWFRFSPRIRVQGLSLGEAASPSARVQDLAIDLDLPASLLAGQWVARRLVVEGLRLNLAPWRLQRLPQRLATPPYLIDWQQVLAASAWLWQQPALDLHDARILVATAEGQESLGQLEAIWRRQEGEGRLSARLRLESGEEVALQLAGQGLPGSPDFQARYYLETSALQLDAQRRLLFPDEVRVERLGVQARLWGRLRGRHEHRLEGRLSLPELDWQDGARNARLRATRARVRWHRQRASWQLGVDGLEGRLNAEPLPMETLMVSGQGLKLQRLTSARVDLAPLWRLLQGSGVLSEAQRQRLAPLQPQGQLRHVNLDLAPATGSGVDDFLLQAELAEVAVSAWRGAPGARGISGRLQLGSRSGRVDLDSRGLELIFPELFSDGWSFSRARGVVGWAFDSEALRLRSSVIGLDNQDLHARGRFALNLPRTRKGDSRLTLMIGMTDSNAALTSSLVPDRVVASKLFNWLDQAVEAGHLEAGGLVYESTLTPGKGNDSLEMFFDARDARVRYRPRWPAIKEARVLTHVRGPEARVQVTEGRLYQETRLQEASIHVPPRARRVQIQARMEGPAADGRIALLESPVGDWLGEDFASWELQGRLQTELDLGIDLEDPEQSRIEVATRLEDGRYASTALGIDIRDIAGRVFYDNDKGLHSDILSGSLFGRPLTAQIETLEDARGSTTQVRGWGSLAVADLRRRGFFEGQSWIAGETDYLFELSLCGYRPGCSSLWVESLLEGVTLDAPAPLGKSAGEDRALRLRLALTPGQQWLHLDYPVLRGLFALEEGRWRGGELVLGTAGKDPVSRPGGFWLRGELETLDLAAWQAFAERLEKPAPGKEGWKTAMPGLKAFNLQVDRAFYQDLEFANAQVGWQPEADGWRLTVTSDRLKGEVVRADPDARVLDIDLDRLYLPAPAEEGTREIDSPGVTGKLRDWRELPPVQLAIRDLRRGAARLGQWNLKAEGTKKSWSATDIQGHLHGIQVSGGLEWRPGVPEGPEGSTRLQLQARGGDLGRLMQGLGSARSLDSDSLTFQADLAWPGEPPDFAWASLDGSALLELERGRLYDTGERPVLKLFSLLNASTLLRRLRLDFADLLGEGLFYDRIRANLELRQGVAHTQEPIRLVSPTYDLDLEGDIDLVREELNMKALVQLPLTDSLPIAAALLSTPAVAGAVFLVERLIGDRIKRFTSLRYRLQGPWQAPRLEPLEAPEGARQPDIDIGPG